MAKYVGNPIIVDAYEIIGVHPMLENGSVDLSLKDYPEDYAMATPEMLARYHPNPGDYWVIQSDGYVYLNPKEVFERKYSPLAEQQAA